eukprot:5540971-Amphidinium_carterae.1
MVPYSQEELRRAPRWIRFYDLDHVRVRVQLLGFDPGRVHDREPDRDSVLAQYLDQAPDQIRDQGHKHETKSITGYMRS